MNPLSPVGDHVAHQTRAIHVAVSHVEWDRVTPVAALAVRRIRFTFSQTFATKEQAKEAKSENAYT